MCGAGYVQPEHYATWDCAVDLLSKETSGAGCLGLVSMFNGLGNMTLACTMMAIACVGFDICNHWKKEDVLNIYGVQHMLASVVRLARGGCLWMGPPCCSWIWLTRSKSKRTATQPEGLGWRDPWVFSHNRIAATVAAFARAAHRLGIYFVIEQTRGSLLFEFPTLKEIISSTGAVSITLNLADFGGDSLKPLCLVGTAPWLHDLASTRFPRGLRLRKLSTRDDHGRVTGNNNYNCSDFWWAFVIVRYFQETWPDVIQGMIPLLSNMNDISLCTGRVARP